MNGKAYFATDLARICNDDILQTELVERESVDLVITSPPYNVEVAYSSHDDALDYDQYLSFTEKWLTRCHELTRSDESYPGRGKDNTHGQRLHASHRQRATHQVAGPRDDTPGRHDVD